MNKKTIIPLGGVWIFGWLLLSSILAGCIYLFIGFFIEKEYFYLISIPIIIVLIYKLIRMSFIRVTLYDEYVFMPSDGLGKSDRVQYETKIYYNEIISISFIEDRKNSKGQYVKSAISAWQLRFYLEFLCNNGKKKRLTIVHYSKKQRNKIIDMIKERAKLSEENINRNLTVAKNKTKNNKK